MKIIMKKLIIRNEKLIFDGVKARIYKNAEMHLKL